MSRFVEFVLDELSISFSIPGIVTRLLANYPEIKIDFKEPFKTVALESVIAWQNWMDSDDNYLDFRNVGLKDRSLCDELISKYDFSKFIITESIDKWQCDISNVEGLSSSKAELDNFSTLDNFAVNGTYNFLEDISEVNLNKILGYREMRIVNNPDTSDHFVWHQWDGRVFLVNDGGSHHFAAAHYIAKKLKKEVTLTGRLKKHSFNQNLILQLLDDFDIFIMMKQDVFGEFYNAVIRYGATFCTYSLPLQFGHKVILLLPRHLKRSSQVANVMNNLGFFNFGKYLSVEACKNNRCFNIVNDKDLKVPL